MNACASIVFVAVGPGKAVDDVGTASHVCVVAIAMASHLSRMLYVVAMTYKKKLGVALVHIKSPEDMDLGRGLLVRVGVQSET